MNEKVIIIECMYDFKGLRAQLSYDYFHLTRLSIVLTIVLHVY